MTNTNESNEQRVRATLAAANGWQHRGSVSCGNREGFRYVDVLREVHDALARCVLPTERLDPASVRFVDFAFLDDDGGGIIGWRESRGFMPGMGQTLSYTCRVADVCAIGMEWWWEDNIADPETIEFHIAAPSPDALERATAAVVAVLAAHGVASTRATATPTSRATER
jgi:hypothetical protein